jgi:hypothetical protein
VRQDVREAHDHGRGQIAGLQALDHLVKVDLVTLGGVRAHHHVSAGVNAEVALAPGLHVVEIEGVLDPPRLCGIELASAVDCALGIGCH